MNENERIAREVLRETRPGVAPDVPQETLDMVYDLEIKHQFSRERTIVANAIDELVNELIAVKDQTGSREADED